jgi:hypothetical protein
MSVAACMDAHDVHAPLVREGEGVGTVFSTARGDVIVPVDSFGGNELLSVFELTDDSPVLLPDVDAAPLIGQ